MNLSHTFFVMVDTCYNQIPFSILDKDWISFPSTKELEDQKFIADIERYLSRRRQLRRKTKLFLRILRNALVFAGEHTIRLTRGFYDQITCRINFQGKMAKISGEEWNYVRRHLVEQGRSVTYTMANNKESRQFATVLVAL